MMFFLWNLLLALFWSFMTGELNLRNIMNGFIIGFIVLLLAERALKIQGYFYKTRKLLTLIFFILSELLKSSLIIAYDILTPRNRMRPGIIKVPLDVKTSTGITLFSNLISLTPGTLSLDVSEDRKYLYVHIMYLDNENLETVKHEIKNKFEKYVLELLR